MSVTDGEMVPELLATHPVPLTQVTADGSYDTWRCYEAIAARPEHPRAVVPPRRVRRRGAPRLSAASIRQHGNTHAPPLDRDAHIRAIRRVGRRQWKRDVAYHRRSRAETHISRDKRIFGEQLTARSFAGQSTEVLLRGALLNRMLWLGRPESYPSA
jgi:hypothetical protein